MADENRLDWSQTQSVWRAEVNKPTSEERPATSRGATYQIRKRGSRPVFELRWLWHPTFEYASPKKRPELERRYTELHWRNPHFTLEFENLSDAMREAQDLERYRLNPGKHAPPVGELKGVRVQFECDVDGGFFAIVDEREADMAGWKIETIDNSIGTRRIAAFHRDIPWGYTNSGKYTCAGYYPGEYRWPWSAICNFGSTIVRWIPPVLTPERSRMLELVRERHAHQVRNGNAATEFWKHCKSAADILEAAITSQSQPRDAAVVADLWLAALGHGLYEHGKPQVVPDDVATAFGQEVADLIAEVTNWKGDEDRAAYLEQLRHAPDKAILIKYADQIDNVETVSSHFNDFHPDEVSRLIGLSAETIDVLDAYVFDDEWKTSGYELRNRLARTWPKLRERTSNAR